jgi:hypothetical protein
MITFAKAIYFEGDTIILAKVMWLFKTWENYFSKINVLIKDETWLFCQMKYIDSKRGIIILANVICRIKFCGKILMCYWKSDN